MKVDKAQWEKDREKLDHLKGLYQSSYGDTLPQGIRDDLADIERGLEKVRPSKLDGWAKVALVGLACLAGWGYYEWHKRRE